VVAMVMVSETLQLLTKQAAVKHSVGY
jgi:hypothetical protein